MQIGEVRVGAGFYSAASIFLWHILIVTVLGLVGGARAGGKTPRVADSPAAGAGRFFHDSVPPSKQNRLGKPPHISGASRPQNRG